MIENIAEMIVTISDSYNDQKIDNVIFTYQFRTSEDIYGFIIIIYNLSSDSSLNMVQKIITLFNHLK